MSKVLNGMAKTLGFIVIQIVYSIGLYLCSLVISCVVSGITFAIFQVVKGFFPCILLWKWLLIGSVPLWIVFEIQVGIKVWKIFHGRKIKPLR